MAACLDANYTTMLLQVLGISTSLDIAALLALPPQVPGIPVIQESEGEEEEAAAEAGGEQGEGESSESQQGQQGLEGREGGLQVGEAEVEAEPQEAGDEPQAELQAAAGEGGEESIEVEDSRNTR